MRHGRPELGLLHELVEVLPLPDLRRGLLLPDERPLLALLRDATGRERLRQPHVLREHAQVVERVEVRQAGEDGLAVGRDLLDEGVAERPQEVQRRGQPPQHPLAHRGGVGEPVRAQVQGLERGELEEIGDVLHSGEPILAHVQRPELPAAAEPGEALERVLREVEGHQVAQGREAGADFGDDVAREVEAQQVGARLEVLNLRDGVALEVQGLEPRERLQALDLQDPLAVQVQNLVQVQPARVPAPLLDHPLQARRRHLERHPAPAVPPVVSFRAPGPPRRRRPGGGRAEGGGGEGVVALLRLTPWHLETSGLGSLVSGLPGERGGAGRGGRERREESLLLGSAGGVALAAWDLPPPRRPRR